MFFFVNLYLQQVLGLGAFASGAALLPLTVTIMIGMIVASPRLIARFGPKVMTVAGLATLAAGLVWLSFVRPNGSFAVDVLPATLVTAAGMAMAFIPSLGTALSAAAPEEGGLASGIVNTSYQIGSTFGLPDAIRGAWSAARRGCCSCAGQMGTCAGGEPSQHHASFSRCGPEPGAAFCLRPHAAVKADGGGLFFPSAALPGSNVDEGRPSGRWAGAEQYRRT